MRFEKCGHYTKETVIKRDTYQAEIDLSHWERDYDGLTGRLQSVFCLRIGPCRTQVDITPTEARALAIILQQHADEVEEHQRQMDEVTA